jgi:hypothetical protein
MHQTTDLPAETKHPFSDRRSGFLTLKESLLFLLCFYPKEFGDIHILPADSGRFSLQLPIA